METLGKKRKRTGSACETESELSDGKELVRSTLEASATIDEEVVSNNIHRADQEQANLETERNLKRDIPPSKF